MLYSRCLGSARKLGDHLPTLSLTKARLYHATSPLLKRAGPSKGIESLYIDTIPPTPSQTAAARTFFGTHRPTKSWTATEWRQQPHSSSNYLTPEVVFLGRSNSGKSSLLNALLNDPELCRVGPKPGKTTLMHAWALSPIDQATGGARKGFSGDTDAKLTVLDMPGYGYGSHGDWGADIMKYLTSRRQLRRAFVLVNPAHGLKKGDLQMLELLCSQGLSHQLIACKCDGMRDISGTLARLQEEVMAKFGGKKNGPRLLTVQDILAVGGLGDGKRNADVKSGTMRGVDDVRWAVLQAAGLTEYAASVATDGIRPMGKLQATPSAEGDTVTAPSATATPVLPEGISKTPAVEDRRPQSRNDSVGTGIHALIAMTRPAKKEKPRDMKKTSTRPSVVPARRPGSRRSPVTKSRVRT